MRQAFEPRGTSVSQNRQWARMAMPCCFIHSSIRSALEKFGCPRVCSMRAHLSSFSKTAKLKWSRKRLWYAGFSMSLAFTQDADGERPPSLVCSHLHPCHRCP